MLWQEEGVGHAIETPALLGVEIAITACQLKNVNDSLVKDLRADQPATGRREGLLVDLAGEKRIVIDVVAVVWVAQLLVEHRRIMLT